MEQLQKDKNYSAYLVRLIGNDLSNYKTKEELVQFINNINRSINSSEVINYVQNNGLIFDYQEYNNGISKLLEQYDRMHDFKTNKTFGSSNSNLSNYKFIPITKLSIDNVSKELIEKVNYLIVNPTINPNDYMVDIDTQVFINVKDNVLYDVEKDNNNSYQLVSKNKNNTNNTNNTSVNSEIDFSKNLENTILMEQNVELTNNDSKFKTLIDKLTPVLNNGFVNTLLLTIISAASGIFLAILLLMKR